MTGTEPSVVADPPDTGQLEQRLLVVANMLDAAVAEVHKAMAELRRTNDAIPLEPDIDGSGDDDR